jgi:hypothetical protein
MLDYANITRNRTLPQLSSCAVGSLLALTAIEAYEKLFIGHDVNGV